MMDQFYVEPCRRRGGRRLMHAVCIQPMIYGYAGSLACHEVAHLP